MARYEPFSRGKSSISPRSCLECKLARTLFAVYKVRGAVRLMSPLFVGGRITNNRIKQIIGDFNHITRNYLMRTQYVTATGRRAIKF